jgi:hypothetical protein
MGYGVAPTPATSVRSCGNCRHFDNRPASLERLFAGLTSFGSGSASVRDEDGVCQLHNRHLSSSSRCPQHSYFSCSMSLTEPQLAPSHLP